ncbi:MAG: ABC transporter substrate-binding protein [Sphaerochaetaceae bacterium]
MKRKLSIVLLLALTLSAVGLFAAGSKEGVPVDLSLFGDKGSQPVEPTTMNVLALKGPTAMGMVELMDEAEDGVVDGVDYRFAIAAAIDEVTPKIVRGEVDIAAVPANLAAVLYNNTKGAIKVLAINTLGVLYIAENGNSVSSVEDLRGKTIYASGKGATPEYALNYILKQNGIDPQKDVTIEWKSEHSECVAAIATASGGIAMLPQPFATTAIMKAPSIRIALDMTKLWDELQQLSDAPSTLVTGVVVGRTSYVEEHPHAIASFLEQYGQSVVFAQRDIPGAASLIEKYGIVPAAVAKQALPYCNIVCITGSEMKTKLSGYLAVLYGQNPKSVGGALPSDGFYFSL